MKFLISYAAHAKQLAPMLMTEIPCGDAVPVEGVEIEWIDLNEYLARGNIDSIIYIHVIGDSMIENGIESGDLLVVDRAAQAQNGNRCVVSVNGEFTVKRWQELFDGTTRRKHLYLVPGNSNFKKRELQPKDNIVFFGTVRYIIKRGD